MCRSLQLLLLASLFGWFAPVWSQAEGDDELLRIVAGTPEGFLALDGKQTTQADVYYGGLFLTTAFVEYDLYQVEILDPRSVIDAIPNVAAPEKLALLLSGPRPSNAEQLCNRRVREGCGKLQPKTVDTIWDEGRFRLDLFVGADELLLHQLAYEKYLPGSTVERSNLHNVRLNFAGTGSQRRYYLGSESFLAFGESRLRSRYAVNNDGFSLYELTWQEDKQDTEFEFGSFRTLGRNIAFTSDLDVLGVRMASSTKRRLDLDKSLGTPVFLFLPERSRVDVYRGRELVHTRYYEAGNQEIDTTGFPDGAYEITLVVTSHSGDESQSTQFFARSAMMPPKGEPQYYLEAGSLVDTETHSALPEFIDEWWVRTGGSYRLRDNLSADGEFIYAGGKSLLQAGIFMLHERWHLYSGAMVGSKGDTGLSVRGGVHWREFHASLDYRQVDTDFRGDGEFDLLPESYKQGTATLSFPIGEGRFFLRGRLNERRNVTEKSVGFSFWAPVIKLGMITANLSFDGNYSRDRSWVQAGIQLRWQGSHDTAVVNPRLQYADDQFGSGMDLLANGRWNGTSKMPFLGESDRSVALQHDPHRSSLSARFVPRDIPLTDFEVGVQRNDQRADLFYAVNNQFSVVNTNGKTSWGDGGNAAGAVLVHVIGVNEGKFEVIVDNRVVGHVWAGTPNVISLRPYQSYEIRIQPVGRQIVGFDQRVQSVTLYPGNVETLHFAVRELNVLVGQLVFADGKPVVNGRFTNVEGVGATDAMGWYQVEVSHTDPLQVDLPNGSRCVAALPEFFPEDGLAVLESITCEMSTQAQR